MRFNRDLTYRVRVCHAPMLFPIHLVYSYSEKYWEIHRWPHESNIVSWEDPRAPIRNPFSLCEAAIKRFIALTISLFYRIVIADAYRWGAFVNPRWRRQFCQQFALSLMLCKQMYHSDMREEITSRLEMLDNFNELSRHPDARLRRQKRQLVDFKY